MAGKAWRPDQPVRERIGAAEEPAGRAAQLRSDRFRTEGNAARRQKPVAPVVPLDEPEAHLHPAWQRRILPAFQRLFSNAQIFVATHSPFVISSLNHGWIHRFRHEGTSRVVLDEPKLASPGDSYLSVLEDLMDVVELRRFQSRSKASSGGAETSVDDFAYRDFIHDPGPVARALG